MGARSRGPSPVLLRSALLALLFVAGAQAQRRTWFKQLPPDNYYRPDVDVTSPVPLPRVPPSPYHMQVDNCPQQNGVPYAVDGYPGTPYLQTPFSTLYHAAPHAQPSITVCRNSQPDPKHCMSAFEITINRVLKRRFDTTIPSCTAFPATELFGYNGEVPGPTITQPVGHETLVRFTNQLDGPFASANQGPCVGTRAGRPTSVHLHGSASLAPFDGWAEDETCRGESKDYIYPNQRAATSWYHDHALHITLESVYRGLAGFFIQSDKAKLGGCGEPYNLEDIEERTMLLSDAVLTTTCQLYYDYFGPHNRNLYGDINLVNGQPWPKMPIEPKWYRFRFLNAATARPFLIKFKNDFGRDIGPEVCRVIASEGGYRADPIPFPREGLQMGVAERYEIVCNFAPYAGRQIYLWNGRNERMFDGVPYFCYSHLLALITVAPTTTIANPPAFDELLLPPSPLYLDRVLTPADVARARQLVALDQPTRTFVFGRNRGLWTINGETWDTATIAASDVGQNTWELWKIRTGGGWFHPIHMHLVDFFVLQRGNNAGVDGLFSFERNSAKDIIFLGPGQEMWVIARFGPHRGSYMFHCHNLVHEDHDMMRAYTVVGGAGLDNLPVANPSTTLEPINTVASVIYNNWGYNDPRLAQTSARPTATWPALAPPYVQSMLDMNLYRIFYALPTDLPGLLPPSNPWFARTCQTLPLLPPPPPVIPQPAVPAVPAPTVPVPVVPVPAPAPVPAAEGMFDEVLSESQEEERSQGMDHYWDNVMRG